MTIKRSKIVALLLSGGVVCGFSGSCLPANFFADLAGELLNSAATTIFGEILNAVVNSTVAG